ncbi:hypothetical protein D9619_002452 [Psilocybe cf. subviscida]|uniref:Uncharacterized protein n=1 Tax=Psilocybe cf. subviscida TaxID=2480587 RepID=A0A8H5AXP4_9AGAR|nr:hypothetical protein D9619_002452 [Psilocybe cf. subviscida]
MLQSFRGLLQQRRIIGAVIPCRAVLRLDMIHMSAVSNACASKRQVLTFRPDRFDSVGQTVADVSNRERVNFYVKQPSDRPTFKKSARLVYASSGQRLPFPPNSRGVLYYHQASGSSTESEIRFRLCDTVGDFQQGTDLLLPNGSPWSISFTRLLKFPEQHAAFHRLLKDEYPLTLESDVAANRIVSTLAPDQLIAHNQRVFDLSGLGVPYIRFSDQLKGTYVYYHQDQAQRNRKMSFPEGTTGVFYYKQSGTAPGQIGELRFRRCSDVLSFDAGEDLCLPSGEIWGISTNRICLTDTYETLKQALFAEGLLDRDLHPGYAVSGNRNFPALTSMSQPFVLDLSAAHLSFDFVGRDMTVHKVSVHYPFRISYGPKRTQPLYQGRAIVRLEPYPLTPYGSKYKPYPLLSIRVLELLTPVMCLSDDDYMLPPVPGELLTVEYNRRGYMPWGFRTNDPLIQKTITDLLQPLPTND